MPESASLFDTLVKLMNFGAAGVGVIVMLFVFFIVIRSEQVDPSRLDLSKMLLRYGLGFATVCAVVAILGPWFQPRPVVDPPKMLLSFSPSFASEKLPMPGIMLPNGDEIGEGKLFVAQSGPVLVRMDDSLKAVKALKSTVETLAETATNAQKQADQAVQALTQANEASSPALESAQAKAINASQQSQHATATIVDAAAKGDYENLARASRRLDQTATGSFKARSAVLGQVSQ